MTVGAPLQQDTDFSKTVFLVVDEKPFYRDMAHQAVMRAKAKDVKHAATVETAIQLLNRLGQGIDCVILDWDIMPVSGIELIRKIRTKSLPKTPARTPIVILTGKADSAAVQAAKALDVNGFAVAPLSVEKLAKTIGNAMNRTWTLQDPSVYAAVPAVRQSNAAPEKPKGIGGPARVIQRGEQVGEGSALPRGSHGGQGGFASANAAKHFKERELKNVQSLPVQKLKTGAILARDVRDKAGHLLLKSGTELKPNLISRLSEVAAGQADYEVLVGEWEEEAAAAPPQ